MLLDNWVWISCGIIEQCHQVLLSNKFSSGKARLPCIKKQIYFNIIQIWKSQLEIPLLYKSNFYIIELCCLTNYFHSFILRSIVLGWISKYWNWSIHEENFLSKDKVRNNYFKSHLKLGSEIKSSLHCGCFDK